MKILITGASGFIGRKLSLRLFQEGHDLVVLSRHPERAKKQMGIPFEGIASDLLESPPPPEAFSKIDAIIHLAGESIATKRWSDSRKRIIEASRVTATRNLLAGLQKSGHPRPGIFLAASAIGIYGDRGDEVLSEASAPGTGFLAELCVDWEKEVSKILEATEAGAPKTRLAILRLGVVLGNNGGMLAEVQSAFSLGLGATLGNGKQWMSWTHIDDVVEAFSFALKNNQVNGTLNISAPNPVTNEEFSEVLANAMDQKTRFKVPAAALRLSLGEMAEIGLGSSRVMPDQLTSLGFQFLYPSLSAALGEIYRSSADHLFECAQFIDRPITEIFKFFSEAKNLEAISPPWLNFRLKYPEMAINIQTGTEIEYRLSVHGVPISWKTRIEDWNENHRFSDTQAEGPFSKWHHTHEFQSLRGGTLMRDRVLYRLPMGLLGNLVAGKFIKNDVRKIFAYRTDKILEIFK